jgi:NitT/TauT family transport system substrate-binding protein
MKSRLKLIIGLAFIASALIITTGCSRTGDGVTVGTWRTAQTIQPFFYEQFLDSDIEVLPFTNPGDQKTALLAGQLDMCGTTMVTAIIAASLEEPIVIVASMANKCSALVVGADSGIETEADLRGKTIAYVPGTMHHILLLNVLENAGIDVSDVTLIRIDFFDMGQALRQGTIDAFLSGEPFPSMAHLEGFGRILSYPYFDDRIGTINAAMITTRERIENNPEMVQSLVNAHVRSTRHLNADREAWIAQALEFGTERSVLEFSMNNIELVYSIDQDFIERTRVLAQEMYALGMITHIPDVEALFDLSFLDAFS